MASFQKVMVKLEKQDVKKKDVYPDKGKIQVHLEMEINCTQCKY